MPNHHEIQGGRPTHKPEDWNEAEHGKCGTLNVLYGQDERGFATMTSRWQFTERELQALRNDGNLFLTIYGQKHPVIALWVQDDVGAVIALEAEPLPAATARDGLVDGLGIPANHDSGLMLTAALAGAIADLEDQAEGNLEVGDIDDAGRVWVRGTVDLKALLEAALEKAAPPAPAAGMVEIPVQTLDSVAAEAQARTALDRAGFRDGEEPPSAD